MGTPSVGMKRRTHTVAGEPPQPVSKLPPKKSKDCLREWEEIPEYLKWNEFITGGYRCHFTWRQCIQSLFTLHNETMNVWTHLGGFLLFFYFAYEVVTSTLSGLDFIHHVLFFIFLLSAIYAFLCSSLYHLFMCHSEPTLYTFLRLDYSGIAALIVGSYIPTLFYSYYQHLTLLIGYLSTIGVVGTSLIVSSIFPFFHSNKFTPIRMFLYMFVAGFGVIPTIHMRFFLEPVEPFLHDNDLIQWRIYGMYLAYFMGVIFYAFKLPESILPGKFNIWVRELVCLTRSFTATNFGTSLCSRELSFTTERSPWYLRIGNVQMWDSPTPIFVFHTILSLTEHQL